jgi:hypothetical protein
LQGRGEPQAERVYLDPCRRGDAGPLTYLAQRLRPGRPCERQGAGHNTLLFGRRRQPGGSPRGTAAADGRRSCGAAARVLARSADHFQFHWTQGWCDDGTAGQTADGACARREAHSSKGRWVAATKQDRPHRIDHSLAGRPYDPAYRAPQVSQGLPLRQATELRSRRAPSAARQHHRPGHRCAWSICCQSQRP